MPTTSPTANAVLPIRLEKIDAAIKVFTDYLETVEDDQQSGADLAQVAEFRETVANIVTARNDLAAQIGAPN